MQKIYEELKKYGLHPYGYKKLKNVFIIETREGKFVVKKNIDKEKIYKYLQSRSFDYYPIILSDYKDDYIIEDFIENIDVPNEQKLVDMIDLVSLLHNKTTHYKEVDESDFKKLYEDISNNIDYLYGYYNDLATLIETKIIMSPSSYLLIRNISKINATLSFCKGELDKWYKLIKNETRQRVVIIHNNLRLDHFIRNQKSYLISWDKSRIDMPIFDLYKLYKNHGLEYDFNFLLSRYESKYKLHDSERLLLFILISLPDIKEFNKSEYEMCKQISNLMDSIYKTEKFLSPYYSKDAKENKK